MTATVPASEKPNILVADDEASIRQILQTRLTLLGYQVTAAANGEEALEACGKIQTDRELLDVMMPKLDGMSVCQQLRTQSDVPIIMLTAVSEIANRVTALELGADDYLVKPFSPKELEARIRCVLRRSQRPQGPDGVIQTTTVIEVAGLKVDINKRQVFKEEERVRLTGMEFSMLELLLSRPGQPFSRNEILQKVWGYTPERHSDTRVVDVHISRLRGKLGDDPENPELIMTARGTGYMFRRISASPEG